MAQPSLAYDKLVAEALLDVVRRVLKEVAEKGLPGEHHFYVSFRTDHPEVEIPARLKQRYPEEMTIVLQHQFWGLDIGEHMFAVTLSFNNTPERLVIPFKSLSAFADPSVHFSLQFEPSVPESKTKQEKPGEAPKSENDKGVVKSLPAARDSLKLEAPDENTASTDASAKIEGREKAPSEGSEGGDNSSNVVTLDRFRKPS